MFRVWEAEFSHRWRLGDNICIRPYPDSKLTVLRLAIISWFWIDGLMDWFMLFLPSIFFSILICGRVSFGSDRLRSRKLIARRQCRSRQCFRCRRLLCMSGPDDPHSHSPSHWTLLTLLGFVMCPRRYSAMFAEFSLIILSPLWRHLSSWHKTHDVSHMDQESCQL
jgi:hypothetical protein